VAFLDLVINSNHATSPTRNYALFYEINFTGIDPTLPELPGGAAVPEPSTMLLLGSGLRGLWGFRRKFKK
jgi:hypothetical protein